MLRRLALRTAVAVALLAPAAASADRIASTGPYAELGLCASGFLGDAARHGAPGPTAAVRLCRDLLSFFSLGARLELISHEATVPPPPDGQYFQLYHLAAEARLGGRIGAVAPFVEGGVGLAMISTNVLAKVALTEPDERVTPVFAAGGGLEYQLMNRHYALGLAGQWTLYPGFEAIQAVAGRLYLRYTY
jgi:hypothetical protein